MKKIIIVFFVLFFNICVSQIINIPDVNFKNFLLQARIDLNFISVPSQTNSNGFPKIDSNNDGQITVQEALLTKRLFIPGFNITSLQGLEQFTNLVGLQFQFYFLQTFNFPTLTNLEELFIYNQDFGAPPPNQVLNVDLTANTKLTTLTITNYLTSLNINSLINLRELSIGSKTLSTLNVQNNLKLVKLFVSAPLSSLSLTNNTKLAQVFLNGGTYSGLNFSTNQNLETFEIFNSELTNLNLGTIQYIKNVNIQNTKLTSFNGANLFNLKTLNLTNNKLQTLSTKNGIIEDEVLLERNPNLTTVCGDSNELVYLQNLINLYGYLATATACELLSNNSSSGKLMAINPNPCQDYFKIETDEKIMSYEIYSASGVLIQQTDQVEGSVDVSSLQTGLYVIVVYLEKRSERMKFLKS